jgi:hypothetical protein
MEPTSPQSPSRRTFLGASAAVLFAGIAIQITGCGTEEDSGANNGSVSASISSVPNHGHKAVVTKAQLDAGGAVTLDIKGSADHTHSVELTADEMATLKKGGHVMKISSVTVHTHTVMFN